MKPTIPEQLAGIRRTLERSVLPAIHDPFLATTVKGLVSDVDTLMRSWAASIEFMRWDVTEMQSLLPRMGAVTERDAGSSTSEAVDPNSLNGIELIEVQDRLRSQLAELSPEIIREQPRSGQRYGHLMDYFERRLDHAMTAGPKRP